MRKSWSEYFMDLAILVAERSTCDRAHVGCVITKNNRIISTGYNGSPHGMPHCDDYGHLMIGGHCVRTVHAEANAIIHAKEDLSGAIVYITHQPCVNCSNLLSMVGASKVYYRHGYQRDESVRYPQTSFSLHQIGDNNGSI